MSAPNSSADHVQHIRFPHLVVGDPEAAAAHSTVRLMAAGDPQPADTNEWDTVFAIKFPDVNTQLAKPGSSPASFDTSDDGATAKGNFAAWQLTGGDGALLHMQVPITTGSATYNGKTYPMNGAVATIEVQLNFLPQPTAADHPAAAANTTGKLKDLKVRLHAAESGSKAVSVTDFEVTPDPGFIVRAIMQGLMEKWFNDHLQEFNHVFSTVDLNMKADHENFQWLKPTDIGYGVYRKGDNIADSVFGVLCMTEGRPVPGNHQISPEAIPGKARSGFLIAQERFLEKLVMPGLPSLFEGASLSDFEMVNSGTQVRNKKALKMEPVNINGTHYTPEIAANNCTISLHAGEIVFELKKAHVKFSPGIDIYMYYSGYSAVDLVTRSDGKQALNYRKSREPVIDHNVEVASWVTWTEVAASVAAAILTLGAGAFAKKVIERITLRVIATIIVLLVGELIANIAVIIEAVAEGKKDELPPVDLVMTNATNPITWPGSKEWTPTSAQLNGPLQFGGDPHFSD